MKKPFITERIADTYMIQRGGEDHDAEWWCPDKDGEPTWQKSIFEGAGIKSREDAVTIMLTLLGGT